MLKRPQLTGLDLNFQGFTGGTDAHFGDFEPACDAPGMVTGKFSGHQGFPDRIRHLLIFRYPRFNLLFFRAVAKQPQLAFRNSKFQQIDCLPDFSRGNLQLFGYLKGNGAGQFPVFGLFFDFVGCKRVCLGVCSVFV